jgi:hypothetical protein
MYIFTFFPRTNECRRTVELVQPSRRTARTDDVKDVIRNLQNSFLHSLSLHKESSSPHCSNASVVPAYARSHGRTSATNITCIRGCLRIPLDSTKSGSQVPLLADTVQQHLWPGSRRCQHHRKWLIIVYVVFPSLPLPLDPELNLTYPLLSHPIHRRPGTITLMIASPRALLPHAPPSLLHPATPRSHLL